MIYQCNFFSNIDINLVVILITEDLINPICTFQMGSVLLKQNLFLFK